MAAVTTVEHSFSDPQLVIVEELLEEAGFGVLIQLLANNGLL